MYRWPWPDHEVEWFVSRARRALMDHPHPNELLDAFLVHLATTDIDDGPVRNLAVWAKKHSLTRLRELIESIEDVSIRRFAEAQVGMPRRRGDLIQIRSKATWWNVRTH